MVPACAGPCSGTFWSTGCLRRTVAHPGIIPCSSPAISSRSCRAVSSGDRPMSTRSTPFPKAWYSAGTIGAGAASVASTRAGCCLLFVRSTRPEPAQIRAGMTAARVPLHRFVTVQDSGAAIRGPHRLWTCSAEPGRRPFCGRRDARGRRAPFHPAQGLTGEPPTGTGAWTRPFPGQQPPCRSSGCSSSWPPWQADR